MEEWFEDEAFWREFFGYFAAREDDLTVLRNVRAGLRPGGAFLMDLVGKE